MLPDRLLQGRSMRRRDVRGSAAVHAGCALSRGSRATVLTKLRRFIAEPGEEHGSWSSPRKTVEKSTLDRLRCVDRGVDRPLSVTSR